MTIVLSTPPFQQFFDDNGDPLSGGLVYTYLAGTLTPTPTYTDQSGLTEKSNPIVLDSAGRTQFWLNNAVSYKFIAKTSAGVTLGNGTTDNVVPFSPPALSTIAANTIVGNNTGATAAPAALTVSQVQSLLAYSGSPITASLSANVALNSTGSFFPGPFVAQGSTGTWFASGKVTLVNNSSGGQFSAKLWDGTNVIDSASASTDVAGRITTISLSGYLTNPASNIVISVKDAANTNGQVLYNQSGSSKDSTITAIRIL